MERIKQSVKCIECSYDLTLLFEFDEWNKPKFLIRKCPDCNTVNKLDTNKKANEPFKAIAIQAKVSKPLPIGPVFDDFMKPTIEQLKAIENERVNKYRAHCMTCGAIISLFLSYLIRFQTEIFPKKEELVINRAPDGLEVEEVKVTFLPPMKKTGRICRDCFNNIPMEAFTSKEYELLPDPQNMQRDGLRNVKQVYTPKYEQRIDRVILEDEFPANSIPDETPNWFYRIHKFDGEIASRVTFSSLTPTESLTKQVVKKVYPLRPSKINVVLHPSRRVRRINIPSFSEVEFTPKDRRASFKRWFENG